MSTNFAKIRSSATFATLAEAGELASPEAAEAFSNTKFDYVIIGGGNGGLPLATRLSEDPNIQVAVIEAGTFHKDDPLIDIPGQAGVAVGNPTYDWAFTTAPQASIADRIMPVPRGKMLGGSSGLNYLAWDRATKVEYDAWKGLSSEAADPKDLHWDWDGFLPFLQKAESAALVSETPDVFHEYSKSGDIINSELSRESTLGSSGAVKVSLNTSYTDNHAPFVRAFNEIGVKTNANPFGGDALGVYNIFKSVDSKAGTRSYAANAYYAPITGRANLKVLTGARATKIIFNKDTGADGNIVASGVEFLVGDQKFVVQAAKEVILCAGVIQTPQLLELSGIGNAKLLKSLGIEPLIDLPNVGENLQDHVFVPTQVVAKQGIETLDKLTADPEFLEEQKKLYAETKTGLMTSADASVAFLPLSTFITNESEFSSLISRLEAAISEADAAGKLTPLLKHVYAIQLEWLKGGKTAQTETLMFSRTLVPVETAGKHCFVILSGIQHPFSRGSVHIESVDPLKAPIIDPKYLSWDFDFESLSASYRMLEKLIDTKSFQSVIDSVVVPPVKLESKEVLRGYIGQTLASGSHLMGTAAMAKKELGGVVSSSLKVYGTANLRVADCSIIPMPIGAHLQATIYAIAEKAADIIKKGL